MWFLLCGVEVEERVCCHAINDEGLLLVDGFISCFKLLGSKHGRYTSPDNNTEATHVRRIWLRFGFIKPMSMSLGGEG
jgi:hypothetical protein